MDDNDDAWSYLFPPSSDLLEQETPLERPPALGSSFVENKNPSVVQKSAPADPHTTRQDASSIISKDGSVNALALASYSAGSGGSGVNGVEPSPPATPKTDFRNSLQQCHTRLMEHHDSPEDSPNFISFRKNHKKAASVETNEDKFDPLLYVDEKFAGTKYRYATIKRNVEFHQLFRLLDLTDRLLDDFSCALSKEFLMQGRMYVTEHNLCFNSNLLGWVTSVSVAFMDVKRIDKKFTAGLFPNGISIQTADSKHNFASFISRDATYDFLRTVWHKSTGKDYSELNETPPMSPENIKADDATEGKISSYILSIDEDENEQKPESDSEYSDDDESVSEAEPLPPIEESPPTVPSTVKRLKDSSGYRNMGPEAHEPTVITKTFENAELENEVCLTHIDAPLGTVFDVLFGSNDTSFHRRFLEAHDASEIGSYDVYHPMDDDPSKLSRSYVYRRALGYSIGPKSTRCNVSETIEHLNFADYVVLLLTTQTPDVPSGGAFTVNNRYYLSWGEKNTTTLRVAYFIKWTGRSWIKNVIEKLAHAAQVAAAKDLVVELNKELALQTTPVLGPPTVAETTPQAVVEPVASVETKKVQKKKPKSTNTWFILLVVAIVVCLAVVLFIQYQLSLALGETRALLEHQTVLTTALLRVVPVDKRTPVQNDFWSLVAGKGPALSRTQQAAFLANQARLLLDL